MKWYLSVISFSALLVLYAVGLPAVQPSAPLYYDLSPYYDLPAVQPSAPPYYDLLPSYDLSSSYDLPPSYEEATTYTLYVKAGEERHFDISELLRLANQGYTTIKIKVPNHTAGSGWTSSAYSSGYGSGALPHCRLSRQDDHYYYRVLLGDTVYESNLSYDDAMLLIGKLVSLDRCLF